jgi:hypothetical protein
MRFALLVLALMACRGSGAKTHRGSAAPVQMIEAPVLPDAGRGSAALSADEAEPNDSDDVATPLPLGGTVHAKLDPDGDVDHFRIDVDRPGALSVMVSAVDQDLVLELADAGGNVIAKSDRGPARTKEGVPNFGVTPGRYTAIVRAAPKKKPAKPPKPPKGRGKGPPPPEPPPPPAPSYEITAQLVPQAGNAEREPNDDRGTANELIVGEPVTGFVGWTGDDDQWKLSIEALSAKNAIDVDVSAVEGVALEVVLTDALGTALLDRKAPKGAALAIRGVVPVIPQGGTPYHYLIVRGDRSNPETAYQLRVSGHVVDVDAEIEPDDTPEHAFPFPADRKVVHASWTPGDVDCFALPVSPSARAIDVVAAPRQGDLDLALEVLVDGKSVASANKGGKNADEKLTAHVPPGSRAVIRVRGADAAATAEGKYDITVNETAE